MKQNNATAVNGTLLDDATKTEHSASTLPHKGAPILSG